MRNSDYWARRMKTMQDAIQDGIYKDVVNLETEFNRAIADINTQMRAWYQRFADNNNISYADARKWLTGTELDEFKWTVEEYIKYGKENALTGQWVKQLENASARVHISRLDSLKLQLQQQAEALGAKTRQVYESTSSYAYTQAYNHTAFEVQRGLGYGWTMQSVDSGRLQKVMSRPWTADGKTFSERIWNNQASLIGEVNTRLTQMIIRGEAPDKAIKSIADRFNVSKKQAGRLVMTESAAMSSAAQKDCFNELDVEMYIDVATVDGETCPVCADLDGHIFKMSEYEVGETAPPWHPWCRCCTAPYFADMEGLGTRASRDPETGKTVHTVPRDMTYREWEKQFLQDDANGLLNSGGGVIIPKGVVGKLNDPGILVTDEKGLKKGFSDFKKHVENMQEPYKSVYQYYAENTELISNPLQMSPIGYDPQKDALTYNAKFLRITKYQQQANIIYSHELAHRYDVLIVKSWKNKQFTDVISTASRKIERDIAGYNRLYNTFYDVNPAFQDILSALSDNRIKTQFGHDSWGSDKRAKEIFANLSYIKANEIAIPKFDGLLDDIIGVFETMFTGGV